ncbi:MAG TPA: hypothetical protein VKG65_04695, partial [Terriglobales bacterium]|nr:hypothetical protein [Terriglobales bacterium]
CNRDCLQDSHATAKVRARGSRPRALWLIAVWRVATSIIAYAAREVQPPCGVARISKPSLG